MPNIAALLKEEITRVARKQIRAELEPLKSAAAQHRRTIASLRMQVTALEKELNALKRRPPTTPVQPEGGEAAHGRFSARGLRSHRARLGLSAGDYGRLVGVTAQSVYNWEQETSRPRSEQLARIIALRSAGKREVARLLQELDGQDAQAAE